MQKMLRNKNTLQQASRMFSIYNYQSASHQRVWMEVEKNGQNKGRMVFELYDSLSPNLAENFTSFCTGEAQGHRSYVGTTFGKGWAGHGIYGGAIDGCDKNLGANNERNVDENLEVRHHKRGVLSLVNDGPHSNGSQFLVTFGEANYLNGYNNVLGELVQGESVLSEMESSCARGCGALGDTWKVTAAGRM